VTLDDGNPLSLPAGSVTGLAAGTYYNLFWNRSTSEYEVELDPAAVRLQSSQHVFVVRQGTLAEDGTPPSSETPPPGYGGGGGYYAGGPIP
jgi:hypothetical protein